MNITQINKRIADMQYCMLQEVDEALKSDNGYLTCKQEYDNSVRIWLDNKKIENDEAMQINGKKLRAAFNVLVEPINQRYKTHMTKLYTKKIKLENLSNTGEQK